MATKSEEPLDKLKEDECHPTHSIKWSWSNKTPTIVTCDKAQTIEDLLKQSSQFRETAEKLKNKELVIIRHGRAISSHFPCSLVKDECLMVNSVEAKDNSKRAVVLSPRSPIKVSSQEVMMFHLWVKGGKNVVRIMRNPALKKEVQEVTVYAYKGEKVEDSLRRDGRFDNIIFENTCALFNISQNCNTELSNLVDGLEDETFQIIQLSKSGPPEGQPSTSEDVSECQQTDPDQTCTKPPTTAQPENRNIPKEEPQTKSVTAPGTGLLELPRSQMLRNYLTSQFRELVKTKKAQDPNLTPFQNLFRVEYGQNDQLCKEVKTMKKLMKLSDSVCLVRTKDQNLGSGFLLFGKFVLTNGHVLQKVYNNYKRELTESVTVIFSYESLDDIHGGQVEVEEIVGFDYQHDTPGRDWALLKLKDEQPLPDGLLSKDWELPQSGGICIIGHPNDGVKKIDTCLIVQPQDRMQVVGRHQNENQGHVQLINSHFFENVKTFAQRYENVLTYESCFYHGSSGSPVFDTHCRVVAMHSGGYVYEDTQGKTQSVIEFGYPLSVIMEHIIVQTVLTERFDVFKECFVRCDVQQREIVEYVRKLIKRSDLAPFKEAVIKAVSSSVIPMLDKKLKEIFEQAIQ